MKRRIFACTVAVLLLSATVPAFAMNSIADPFTADGDLLRASSPTENSLESRVGHKGGSTLAVDDDLVDCPDADYTTIQAAVDAAAALPGTTKIEVCAGTYAENVSIGAGNRIKLEGAGAGNTVITGVAGTAGPIIDVIFAGDVDIKKLTVDGGSAMAGGVVTGIRYDETDGEIREVEVLNVRNASGSSQGVGIRVQSSGPKTKVKVYRSLIANYTRVGVNGNGPGVDLKVEKCDVVGPIPPTVWAPNGIQMSRGAAGRIKENFVDNNPSPNVPGGAGSGIILFCPGETTVDKNLVTRADLGISVVDAAGNRIYKNDIAESDFDAISLQFLGLFFGDIGCTAPGAPLPVMDNEIKQNNIFDSGDTGISFANFDATTLPGTPNDNTVKDNEIDSSAVDGIHVFAFGANPADNVFEKNEITASGSTDAVDETTGTGTAGTANEWKRNKCATSSPAGLC